MTSELKPCPFCGGDAVAIEDSEHSTAYSLQHHSKSCPIDDLWDWYPDKEQAVAAWNTRAAPAPAVEPMPDMRDFLLKACSRIEQQLDVNERYFSAHDKETLSILQSHIRDDLKAIRAALAALDPMSDPRVVALVDALKRIADADNPYEPCGWAINTALAALAAFDTP